MNLYRITKLGHGKTESKHVSHRVKKLISRDNLSEKQKTSRAGKRNYGLNNYTKIRKKAKKNRQ